MDLIKLVSVLAMWMAVFLELYLAASRSGLCKAVLHS